MTQETGSPARRFEPYPAYKPSGIEWLGEIPAHWEVHRLKTIASADLSNVDKKSVEGEEPVRLCNYVDVYYHERITGDLEFMNATATPDQIRRFALRSGDVLITKDSETADDIAVPAVVVEDLTGVICGYHLAHVRPDQAKVDGRFLAQAFRAIGPRDQFHAAANGITRFGLTGDAIRSAVFGVPPLDEQRAVATFLDRETAKIDALVTKKERLIELLEEKRAALISQAVTRGLDPEVPMKESGVQWLGEIPRHWSAAPVYSRFQVQLGKMLDASRITGERLAPYLRNVDVQWDRINTADLPQMDFSAEDRTRFSLTPGDLLVCEGGEVGRAAIWRGELQECYYQKAVHRLRPATSEGIPRFLFYVLLAAARTGVFVATGNPNTIDHLTAEKFRKHRLAFPPAEEQRGIASFLDGENTELETLIAKIRDAIEKLREYRTALISAAVTGKIDVRDTRNTGA